MSWKLKSSSVQVACMLLIGLLAPMLAVGVARAAAGPKYPAWVEGATYQAGAKVSYSGNDYQALVYQTDWLGSGWTPAGSPTLWTLLGPDPGSPVIPPPPPPPPPTGTCQPQWSATTAYTAGAKVTYNGINYQANWWTEGNEPDTDSGPSGSGKPWTQIAGCNGKGPIIPPPPPPPPPPPNPPNPNDTSTGTIHFHLLLGAGTAEDSLTLDGGNYTDLIMSNVIAGVMMGHLIDEDYPGLQFDKDYLYGSMLGQLLQENIETELYNSSSKQIDPSPLQAAVMGLGQGGPYQINNYAVDMVSGTYAPAGHSLIDYVALQKNIGYSFANAGTQYMKNTPPSFNEEYFGPMLTAYFHYNDFVALRTIGTGPGGWQTEWQPAYDKALNNFVSLPDNFLDILLNSAYNQGYYGPLVTQYSSMGATATPATIAQVNDFSSVWGSSDTYRQYPYQVRYYLNQFYDLPNPTTGPDVLATPQNHVDFSVSQLSAVFSSVFSSLSYLNQSSQLTSVTPAQAQAAFTAACKQAGVASTASLDLSKTTDRAQIFAILEDGIENLEQSTGAQFNATSNVQH